jgi:hypothetical protein
MVETFLGENVVGKIVEMYVIFSPIADATHIIGSGSGKEGFSFPIECRLQVG